MRRIRGSVLVFCWLTIAGLALSGSAEAQSKQYGPKDLLGLKPKLPGVDYDTPADARAVEACKVERVMTQNRWIGYALRDGQGKMLRRFVANHGKMDQWSYYQDGFEVYREIDLDGDQVVDEARWMNAGGTRVASVKRGKIVGWKQISAEEASKVFVQGLVLAMGQERDTSLLDSVMSTPAELSAAGLPSDLVDKMASAAAARGDKVTALLRSLAGWNRQTVWNRFDGTYPHVIPADPGSGPEKDVVVYENAMIFPGNGASQADASAAPPRMAFLQIPDMIKLGECWKFVDLPRAIDPEKPVVTSVGGIRALLFDRANNVQPRDEAFETALKALADYDGKYASTLATSGPREVAQYYVGRIDYLRAIVKALKSEDDKLSYDKQVVDSLVAAVRTGEYPAGRKTIEQVVAKGGKLSSYAAYSLIGADFAAKNNQAGANVLANQKSWMADLEEFLAKHADADEAPEALLQLASANEYNGDEDIAIKRFTKVVETYPKSEAARKAAGSLRRLELVGKTLAIKGPGLQSETIDTSAYHGKTVLVVFWANWATRFKTDLPELRKLQDKYRSRGLEIIGINLDNDRAEVDAFLKSNPLSWPQIFEGGGLEGRLAVEYGITSVPTMFLADAKGTVINRNIPSATDLDRQLEKLLTARAPAAGVALDKP